MGIGVGISVGVGAVVMQPSAAPPETHAITASAGAHGSISPVGVTTVNEGASQQFAFAGNSGYAVASVTVDDVPVATSSPYTFTNVTATHTIAVAFVLIETLARTAKGTWAFATQGETGEFESSSITVPAGHTLILALANNTEGCAPQTPSFAGGAMSLVAEQYDTESAFIYLSIYRRYCATETTGVIYVSFYGPPMSVLMLASSQAGIISGAADKAVGGMAVGSTPNSPTTGTLTQAHEMAYGFVLADVPNTDNLSNWAGIWTSGQRINVSNFSEMTLSEGYSIRTVDTAIVASKGLTSTMNLWIAICATFKAAS